MNKTIDNCALFVKLKNLETTNPQISSNIKNNLVEVAEKILNRIPQFMPEYTMHDINHSFNVLDIINKILPNKVVLNIVELQILIYAVVLHDIGMVVNTNEAEELKKSEEFNKIIKEFENNIDDGEILTELIRRTHVQRSVQYINRFKEDFATYKVDFSFNGVDISDEIKKIIVSHELAVSDLKDSKKYPIEHLIDSYRVNMQFLAVLLRLGDILDFDISRTPYYLSKHIGLNNKNSILEWYKHQAIIGREYTPEKVAFTARPKSIQIHRKIEDFVGWIEFERKESIELLDGSVNRSTYYLDLRSEIKAEIIPDGYKYTKLEINLDYEKVLQILMGTELYDNVDVFLRELLQNSYDACKYYQEIYDRTKSDFDDEYKPKIIISYNSEDNILEVQDNGIGIDENTFASYVITVGKSYYKSKYFASEECNFQPISNFGIGILSCFMVSDSIEIESFKKGNLPIHFIMSIKDKYITKLDTSMNRNGTKIKLKLHSDFFEKIENQNLSKIIESAMIKYPIPITLKQTSKPDIILDNCEINIPKYDSIIDDIIVTPLKQESDHLEGYIALAKYGKGEYLEKSELAQQNFVITNKKNHIDLKPLWIMHGSMNYKINIPDIKKLSLKASRNSIKEDKNLLSLKEIVTQKIIDCFKLDDDFWNKSRGYFDEGRGKILRFQNEYEFLTSIKMFMTFSIQNSTTKNIEIMSFQSLAQRFTFNAEIKIAILRLPYLLSTQKDLYLSYLMKHDYSYIIIDQVRERHYFYQFIQPICTKNEIIIGDIEGLVYQSITIKKQKNLAIDMYNDKYSWDEVNQNINPQYFAIISNNQYNGTDILLINKIHILGQLLKEYKEKNYIKAFINSLTNNFVFYAIGKSTELKSFQWLPTSNHFFFDSSNYDAYPLHFIRCMTTEFLESLNFALGQYVLINLVNDKILEEHEKAKYYLERKDFPSWYFQE